MPKLNIKNDFIFKEVFASNDELSRGALQDLLSTYLCREVVDVNVTTNEIRSNYLLQKETRMDINVIFNNGERANIEMQLVNQKEELVPRMIYYLTQLFQSQTLKKKRYTDLHNTYSILIANFIVINDEKQYHDYKLEDGPSILSDLLHVIIIELPKVKEKDVSEMSKIEGWNYFFRNYENEEKKGIIELIKKKWRGVAMAEEKITQITPEELARIQQIYDDRWRLEQEWLFEDALEKKFDEGIEKGEMKAKAELIQQMLEKLSIEETANILNISVDEIKTMI